uniref:Serine/threonine-protein phosphatase 4 regulatory subunit 4 n=1 Tax=Parascaris univalens TaxID=6257 RepID=A0A914ZLX9_PARUN
MGERADMDEEEHHESVIDWSSLLSAADDPEMEELLRSPLDTAIHVLREGREIQKLSAIRTFADLLDTEGEKAIELVLPLIQKVLEEETANLDIHCEAAVTYKNIFRNTKLTSRFTGLTDIILSGILRNVARQKDNLSAAAWLETLVEVLDNVPLPAIKDSILPVALSQAEPTQRVQRRVIATKLIEKLCTVLPALDVRKELAPCAQMLAQDPNANVRGSIAQRLGFIAQSLHNANDCGTLLLPCLIELCKDDDVGVREAILNTVAICLPHFSKESSKSAIIPLLKKSTEQAVFLQDETLSVVAKNLGQWIYNLKDTMSVNERKWFLDMFIRIANLAQSSSTTSTNGNSNSIHTLARRMCAYNFPCIVLVYGEECFMDRLLPIFEGFCSDPDEEIRCATAAGFHEVVNLVPNEPALIPPFIELIRGGAAEVVAHLTGNLDRILPALYKCVSDRSRINRVQLDRILIGCDRLIRGTGSWRAHHSYLTNIAVIRKLIPIKEVFISFVPMLKQEVLTARAIPCRVAASLTLLLFMRENGDKSERQSIVDFFVHSVAKHRSCHRRRLYLDIIPLIMANFSRPFFHSNFLETALKMANDGVSNIRLQLCHLLPKIKENLILPDDEAILQQLERIVREMLTKEQNSFSRQLIQTYACELSRAETKVNADKMDEAKLKEEKEMWERTSDEENNNDEKAKDVEKEERIRTLKEGTSKKPPVGVRNRVEANPWRMRTPQPKTAIVRPQPHVVVRSPSPMPRPLADDRKSKLPLVNGSQTPTAGKHISRAAAALVNRTTAAPEKSRSTEKSKLRPPSAQNNPSTAQLNAIPLPPSHTRLPTNRSTPVPNAGLRRSSTAANDLKTVSVTPARSSNLPTTRSSSCVRRPVHGLIKVRSFSSIEKMPAHMNMKIHTIE